MNKYRISFNGIQTEHEFVSDDAAFSYAGECTDSAAMATVEKLVGGGWVSI